MQERAICVANAARFFHHLLLQPVTEDHRFGSCAAICRGKGGGDRDRRAYALCAGRG